VPTERDLSLLPIIAPETGEVLRPRLSPIYQDLLNFAPNIKIPPEAAGIKVPAEENADAYRQMADFLRANFSEMDYQQKIDYLGLVRFESGKYLAGTNKPIQDRRQGLRYDESPMRDASVPYPYYLTETMVPNILYEVAASDMGGYQVRTHHSEDHMHPAVNVMQGNAATAIRWLSKISGLELRLPTEAEWENAAYVLGNGHEYVYGTDVADRGAAHTFNSSKYHAVEVGEDNGLNLPIVMGGNVWEMTTPTLEEDFKQIRSNNGAIISGIYYNAKGGGFQHCTLGPRRAQNMVCDPIVRSPSLGFRIAMAESYAENKTGGWRRKTSVVTGNTIFKPERRFPMSSISVVQTAQTRGLTISVNGTDMPINTDRILGTASPVRANMIRMGENGVIQMEHMLAAMAGLGIWNAKIVLNGESAPPAVDFSAQSFAELITEGNLVKGADRTIVVNEAFSIDSGGSSIVFTPGNTEYEVEIDYQNPHIGKQTASFSPDRDDFNTKVAFARSFATLPVTDGSRWQEIQSIVDGLPPLEQIRESKMLVSGNTGWQTQLVCDNEPAIHKLLDIMGDLALLGYPIQSNIHAYKPGHNVNVQAVIKIGEMLRNNDPRIEIQEMAQV
jgi:UDP-3-O-[3-hydroxymyristoyl] N-acetylglucosamine deacetylase